MSNQKRTRILSRLLAITLAVLPLLWARPAAAICDCSTLPTLGKAGLYPAFGLGAVYVYLQGSAFAEDGNIGAGPGATVNLQGAAGIDGFVHHHDGPPSPVTSPSKALGGVFQVDMSGAIADALAANVAFAALAPTQTFGSLTGNTTITGNGCINIIQVNGDVDLQGNETVRLQGGADDYFVVNIGGYIDVQGNADIVLDGMAPDHVIFNITAPGNDVAMEGNSGGNGTFLNPGGEVYLHGNAGGRGGYYAGVNLLHFQGNADFFGRTFKCGNSSCPDPELSGVNIQTPATPSSRTTGNRSFFYSYFDPATFEGHLEAFRVAPDGVLKDKLGADAIDSVTKELVAGRTPYWDAGTELKTNVVRTMYTTQAGLRVNFDNTNVDEVDLDLLVGEIPSYPNFPASGINTLPKLRDAVIQYVRGKDAFDADGDNDFTEMRPSVLGDIFRSNPLFIGSPQSLLSHEDGYATFASNYDQRDRVVYAGANDGAFHAFAAGAWWDPNDPLAFNSGTGAELFGYVPGLLLQSIKLTPRTNDITGERLAPGFVDGNISAADAWLGDGSGTDTTKSDDEWATTAITAYREGGRGYLALDITKPGAAVGDPHYPYPKYLWEFTHADLGQSWSRPIITRVKVEGVAGTGDNCGANDGDGDCREQWVAIFGAGYELESNPNDSAYLGNPASAAWTDRSKAIFMVALDTGAVLAQVKFDVLGLNGHTAMKYGVPSAPAVIDLNYDSFADVVYIGDESGQLWKWDVSAVGADTAGDAKIDNWASGIFFNAARASLALAGTYHYHSMFFPLSAAYVNGKLTLAFGTGERADLNYEGVASPIDDNNRFYVVRDLNPTGASAFPGALTESDLTDVTALGTYVPPGNSGYFFKGVENEKFVTEIAIFEGYVLAASFTNDVFPSCGPGVATFYAFELATGQGFFDTDSLYTASDRKLVIGAGIPSNPRVSIASDPTDDVVFVNTSDGQVVTIEPPLRPGPDSDTVYWRRKF